MQPVEINKDIFWVGALDWISGDFHGYSTPKGTSYNAYLVKDEKVALFDTVKKPFTKELVASIRAIIDPRLIDYLVVNHVEMDHSGAVPEMIELIGPEKVICSPMGKKALIEHYHRENWPFEVVETGRCLSLEAPPSVSWKPHAPWPDSMMSLFRRKAADIERRFRQQWATSQRFVEEVGQRRPHVPRGVIYAKFLLLFSPLVRNSSQRSPTWGSLSTYRARPRLIWRSNPRDHRGLRGGAGRKAPEALIVYDTMWQANRVMACA